MTTSTGDVSSPPLDVLYREIDELLLRRVEDYPRRVEPNWSSLLAKLADVADILWAQAEASPARENEGERASDLTALAERPVFVLGYYKSGTTLLLNLLDGHPDLVALPSESRHFPGLAQQLASLPAPQRLARLHAEWIRRLISPAGVPPFWTLGRPWELEDDPYSTFSRHLLQFGCARGDLDLLGCVAQALAATAGTDPRLWVEKTPKHEFQLARIRRAYPDARFAHIVRDPRTVVRSILHYGDDRLIVDPLTAAFELGRSLAVADTNRAERDRFLVLRYEDLVKDPAASMQTVARFLGVAFDPIMLIPTVGGRPGTANAGDPSRRVVGQIQTLSATQANDLRQTHRWAIAAVAGRSSRRLGYDVPRGKALVRLAVRAELWRRYRLRRR